MRTTSIAPRVFASPFRFGMKPRAISSRFCGELLAHAKEFGARLVTLMEVHETGKLTSPLPYAAPSRPKDSPRPPRCLLRGE